jgi:hypothetical protein
MVPATRVPRAVEADLRQAGAPPGVPVRPVQPPELHQECAVPRDAAVGGRHARRGVRALGAVPGAAAGGQAADAERRRCARGEAGPEPPRLHPAGEDRLAVRRHLRRPVASTGDGRPELLARLQIGHAEANERAVDGLLYALEKAEKSVLSVLGRANISAMVQLLTVTASSNGRWGWFGDGGVEEAVCRRGSF